MKIIRIDDLEPQPWKNGGGVTREIALCTDDAGMIWRLSVADVEQNGPFSIFPGAARILTVIEGAGLRLRQSDSVIDAPAFLPVHFRGDVPTECDLVSGPVRDFNLIYDPERVAMSVVRLDVGARMIKGEPVGLLPLGAYCTVAGFGHVPLGSFLRLGESQSAEVSVEGSALLVTIDHESERSAATALR
ncbi:MAG: HutD family protein [Pseudomonadota bacterium]